MISKVLDVEIYVGSAGDCRQDGGLLRLHGLLDGKDEGPRGPSGGGSGGIGSPDFITFQAFQARMIKLRKIFLGNIWLCALVL